MPSAMMDLELLRVHREGGVLPGPKPRGPPKDAQKRKTSIEGSPEAPKDESQEGEVPAPAPTKPVPSNDIIIKPPQPPTAKSMTVALEKKKHIESRHESLHWESCGKQVTSNRPSRPNFSIGQKTRFFQDVRCREICQHPQAANPGPEYNPRATSAPASVLKNFGSDKRFLEEIELGGSQATAAPDPKGAKKIEIKHSTQASPFSATFPYAEPPSLDKAEEKEKFDKLVKSLEKLGTTPRQPAVVEPDLNHQYCKYNTSQHYSFGSSCIGHRFLEGTSFSRKPPKAQHTPRLGFRERRSNLKDVPSLLMMERRPSGAEASVES